MALFGFLARPPDVAKMEVEGNIKGILEALRYWKSTQVREAAAQALGRLGMPSMAAPLVAAIKEDPEDSVRTAAVNSLGCMGESAASLLIALIREEASMATATMSSFQARRLPFPSDRIDAHKRVIEFAKTALTTIGSLAVEPLIELVGDDDRLTVAAACETLGRIGDPRAVELLLSRVLNGDVSDSEDLRRALENIGTKAVPLLIPFVGEEKEGLGEMAGPRHSDVIAA